MPSRMHTPDYPSLTFREKQSANHGRNQRVPDTPRPRGAFAGSPGARRRPGGFGSPLRPESLGERPVTDRRVNALVSAVLHAGGAGRVRRDRMPSTLPRASTAGRRPTTAERAIHDRR